MQPLSSTRFDDCVAIVTGASRGIGAAVARVLGARGAQLVLVARTVGGLEETDDAVRKAGGKPSLLVPFDLAETGTKNLDVLGGHIFERFGRADILLGIAGILDALEPAAHADPGHWTRIMAVNALANQRLIRTLDPLLRKAPHGRAVFATCSLGADTKAYWSAYRASKAALEQLVFSYAAETATTSLRVNLVDPGPVATKLYSTAFPGIDPKTLASPDNVAPLFSRLLSRDFRRQGGFFKPNKALSVNPGSQGRPDEQQTLDKAALNLIFRASDIRYFCV